MAAAIIPIILSVAGAVAKIAPLVPDAVHFVESLFGHSTETGQKDGEKKLETVIALLTAALQNLANAGKIPSAGVVDPALPAALAGAIQQVVTTLNAGGELGPSAPAPGPPAPTNVPIGMAPIGGGYLFSGTLKAV